MRITQSSMIRQYTTRLGKSLNSMNTANQKVTTGRNFLKSSENPAAAAKAVNLIRQYTRNDTYLSNLNDAKRLYETSEGAMMSISKSAEDAYVDILSAVNGPKSLEERNILAAHIRKLQESIVIDANATFGDQFIFGGSSTKEVPFKFENGVLTYRGINVDDQSQIAALDDFSNEKIYIDVGFGLSFDNSASSPNTVVPGTAVDISMPGINLLGYGNDPVTGLPNNIVTLLGKIADTLEQDPLPEDEIQILAKQLDKNRRDILVDITQTGTAYNFMQFTINRLEDVQFNLDERIQKTVYNDPAKAIVDFDMYQYSYNVALKMGSSILSPSFIDFMK